MSWQRAAACNTSPGRGRAFNNVGPAWEAKAKVFAVAVRNSSCQVFAVRSHCEHRGAGFFQRDFVGLVPVPNSADSVNVSLLALPLCGEQHAHSLPCNALNLTREQIKLHSSAAVSLSERWVQTANAGKAITGGTGRAKVLADLTTVAAERLPEQRSDCVGIHCHVTPRILRIHNVVKEATHLVLITKRVANNFHLCIAWSSKNLNGFANASVRTPSKFNFTNNTFVISAGAWPTKASVRANNWEAGRVLGLSAHTDKPSLLFRRKVFKLLALQRLKSFNGLLAALFGLAAAPAQEQKHSVLVLLMLAVLIQIWFDVSFVAERAISLFN